MPARIPADVEQQVIELLRDGLPYRKIAEQSGVSVGTVRAVAKRNDVDTSTRVAHVEQAASMNKARAAERRHALTVRLYVQADQLLDQKNRPALVHSFGGKENTYNEHTIPAPTFSDKRNIMRWGSHCSEPTSSNYGTTKVNAPTVAWTTGTPRRRHRSRRRQRR